MKIPFDFNQMEFFEFIWYYERLVKEKQKESENINTTDKENIRGKQVDLAEQFKRSQGFE